MCDNFTVRNKRSSKTQISKGCSSNFIADFPVCLFLSVCLLGFSFLPSSWSFGLYVWMNLQRLSIGHIPFIHYTGSVCSYKHSNGEDNTIA